MLVFLLSGFSIFASGYPFNCWTNSSAIFFSRRSIYISSTLPTLVLDFSMIDEFMINILPGPFFSTLQCPLLHVLEVYIIGHLVA